MWKLLVILVVIKLYARINIFRIFSGLYLSVFTLNREIANQKKSHLDLFTQRGFIIISSFCKNNLCLDYKRAFSLYDKANNGTILARQLLKVLRNLGENPTEDEIQNIMNEVNEWASQYFNFNLNFGILGS